LRSEVTEETNPAVSNAQAVVTGLGVVGSDCCDRRSSAE
jgi:hypothetical protein